MPDENENKNPQDSANNTDDRRLTGSSMLEHSSVCPNSRLQASDVTPPEPEIVSTEKKATKAPELFIFKETRTARISPPRLLDDFTELPVPAGSLTSKASGAPSSAVSTAAAQPAVGAVSLPSTSIALCAPALSQAAAVALSSSGDSLTSKASGAPSSALSIAVAQPAVGAVSLPTTSTAPSAPPRSQAAAKALPTPGADANAGVDGDSWERLVRKLERHGCEEHVARVMRRLPRGAFLPPASRACAADNRPIRYGALHQSAPLIYSTVLGALELGPGQSFLNVGSGTGYLSALASLLLGAAGFNHGVELQQVVVDYAEDTLDRVMKDYRLKDDSSFCKPTFYCGNGLRLGPLSTLYDRVYCGAGCPPRYRYYFQRLIKVGGVLVLPLGDQLLQVRRVSETEWSSRCLCKVIFATLEEPRENETSRITLGSLTGIASGAPSLALSTAAAQPAVGAVSLPSTSTAPSAPPRSQASAEALPTPEGSLTCKASGVPSPAVSTAAAQPAVGAVSLPTTSTAPCAPPRSQAAAEALPTPEGSLTCKASGVPSPAASTAAAQPAVGAVSLPSTSTAPSAPPRSQAATEALPTPESSLTSKASGAPSPAVPWSTNPMAFQVAASMFSTRVGSLTSKASGAPSSALSIAAAQPAVGAVSLPTTSTAPSAPPRSQAAAKALPTPGADANEGVDGDSWERLVRKLERHGCEEHVARVMRRLPRGAFLPPASRACAADNRPIRYGALHQSAPLIYSSVLGALELGPGQSFLNVGSGTGYLSALAGLLLGAAGFNHGVELQRVVVDYAEDTLDRVMKDYRLKDDSSFCKPTFYCGNGLRLAPLSTLYDRVYCGAGCPPRYRYYFQLLIKVGGVLVLPLGDQLLQVRRVSETEWSSKCLCKVIFATLEEPRENETSRITLGSLTRIASGAPSPAVSTTAAQSAEGAVSLPTTSTAPSAPARSQAAAAALPTPNSRRNPSTETNRLADNLRYLCTIMSDFEPQSTTERIQYLTEAGQAREFGQGYVFTLQAMIPGQTIHVEMQATVEASCITVGLCFCDPTTLRPTELPDDPEQLQDRPEYQFWRSSGGLVAKDQVEIIRVEDGSFRAYGIIRGLSMATFDVHPSVPFWGFVHISGRQRAKMMIFSSLTNTVAERRDPPESLEISPPPEEPQQASIAPLNSQSTVENTNENSSECLICCSETINSAIVDCGHMCMCYQCALKVWRGEGNGVCPVCRKVITNVIRIYAV